MKNSKKNTHCTTTSNKRESWSNDNQKLFSFSKAPELEPHDRM